MTPFLKLQVEGSRATITMNRPDKRNALHRDAIAELLQMFGDLQLEKRIRAVILTGEGTAFCAGMDLDEMKATAEATDPHLLWRRDAELYQELLEKMLRFPKPILAAVNGPAVAGGAGVV
ncbi:MAG: enoyl-CoA hydratase/isomerase family protein, partial [Planctomycetales bacterium]